MLAQLDFSAVKERLYRARCSPDLSNCAWYARHELGNSASGGVDKKNSCIWEKQPSAWTSRLVSRAEAASRSASNSGSRTHSSHQTMSSESTSTSCNERGPQLRRAYLSRLCRLTVSLSRKMLEPPNNPTEKVLYSAGDRME